MKKLILVFAVLAIVFTACRKEFKEKETEPEVVSKTMDDLSVGDNFDWKTTKDVSVLLNGSTRSAVFVNSIQGFTYHKGILFSGKEYSTKITVPAYVKKVELVYDGEKYEVLIENNKVEYTFQ